MVEQALLKRWTARLADLKMAKPDTEARLKQLLSYEEQANPFDAIETKALINILDTTKVLDPACGSGAFPMGVLHRMVRVLHKLDPGNKLWKERQLETHENSDLSPDIKDEQIARLKVIFEENDDDYGRKLFLIEKCIYGVDIQPIAVQIAKLRCFISLVVDQKVDEAKPNRGVLELPNLETKFVTANTLNSIQGQTQLKSEEFRALEIELNAVRAKHFKARRYEQKKKLRERDRELSKQIGEWLKENHMLNKEEAGSLVAWNPYDQNASAPIFDAEWMFGPEFSKPRFDVVVGNPPYVRQEKIEQKDKLRYQELYGRVYTGTADLYIYFYARSLELLATDGIISFVSSNKYFRSGYGKKLRSYLVKETQIELIIDFEDADVFEGTIAYPSIFVAKKSHSITHRLRVLPWDKAWNDKKFKEYFIEKSFEMPQTSLLEDGWRFDNPQVFEIMNKIKNCGTTMGKLVNNRFYRGVLTGLNEAFIVDEETKNKLIKEDKNSSYLLKPVLKGRDVKRWTISFQKKWMIFTRRGTDISGYPAIKKHLEKFKLNLTPGTKEGRKPGSYEWFEVQDNIAYWEEFSKNKIVFPDIANAPQFAWDDSGFYLANTLYLIPEAPKWLLGYLNSKVAFWYYLRLSPQIQGGFVRFISQYMAVLPVPNFSAEAIKKLTDLVDRASLTSEGRIDIEQAINCIIFEAAKLSTEEIRIIESGLNARSGVDAKVALMDGVVNPLAKEFTYFNLEIVREGSVALELDLTDESVGKYLSTLAEESVVYDAGKGWYSSVAEPMDLDSAPVKDIAVILKALFPKVDVTCWSTQQLVPYMQHLLAKHLIFVSTDRAGLETIGQALEEAGYTVHVNPGKAEAKRVVPGDKVVVLRPSLSREPKEGVFALPEKVLVDLFYEVQELGFIDQKEFSLILENILKNKRISNFSKLINYLERRADPKKATETGFFLGVESLIAGFLEKPAKKD
jgi:hypothetical protein